MVVTMQKYLYMSYYRALIIAEYYYQVLAKQGVEPSFPQNGYRRGKCKHTNTSIKLRKIVHNYKNNELSCITQCVCGFLYMWACMKNLNGDQKNNFQWKSLSLDLSVITQFQFVDVKLR